jgi:hypothetical protein
LNRSHGRGREVLPVVGHVLVVVLEARRDVREEDGHVPETVVVYSPAWHRTALGHDDGVHPNARDVAARVMSGAVVGQSEQESGGEAPRRREDNGIDMVLATAPSAGMLAEARVQSRPAG